MLRPERSEIRDHRATSSLSLGVFVDLGFSSDEEKRLG
jgi:hypothetical protein